MTNYGDEATVRGILTGTGDTWASDTPGRPVPCGSGESIGLTYRIEATKPKRATGQAKTVR
ncbi:hypothetical protein ACIBCA_12910 [Kitasatospora sp. NPDC051170]|uniref:hypothetical protein n=1 Tax=Kitasatospora sp. NPDC051170 TaxID=3364056 RepID=UPI00379EECB1